MTAYVTRPAKAWQNSWFETMSGRPSETVIESDPTPKPIGLVDQHGVEIYRVEDRLPLGFDLSKGRKA